MFKVSISKIAGFTPAQAEKLEKARVAFEAVWNSEEFKTKVRTFSYPTTKTTGALWWKKTEHFRNPWFRMNQGLDREDILQCLLEGDEKLQPGDDGEADLQITLYAEASSTVGYTYPTTIMQWINAKFFNSFTIPEVVGNLAHEYCHKLGFDHEYDSTPLRPYTVPYAIGYISRDLAKKMGF